MSQGLANAYGVQGAYQSLDQLLAQRMQDRIASEAERRARADEALRAQSIANQSRQLDQVDAERKATLAENARYHDQVANEHAVTAGQSLINEIPAGARLGESDPAVGMIRTGGGSGLLQPVDERPAVDVGPLQPGDTGAALPKGFIKTASAKQASDAAAKAERDAQITETGRHNRAMEDAANKRASQQQSPTVVVQTVDDQGNPVTRIVPKTAGASYQRPKSPQEMQHETAKKEASATLDQLDQAIEQARPLIGPGAGRFSNIEQMIGSADPKIQALGVKMRAAKMQFDHAAAGSVRAAASPTLLKQWDNILANNITPEGLKAGVQAMREVLGVSAPASSGVKVLSITPVK